MPEHTVVLITGSASGFGFRTALTFARHGCTTYASVRNSQSEGAKRLVAIAKTEQLPLHIIPIDVSDESSVRNAVSAIKQKEHHIDILVNNAGWSDKGPVETYSIADIQKQYETNIFGMVRLVKAVAPIMREHKRGKIINISSLAGRVPLPFAGVYSSAKHALEALSETLWFELSHFGIHVTIVEPGSFLTEGYNRNFKNLHASSQTSIYSGATSTYIKTIEKTRKAAEQSPFFVSLFNPQRVADKIYRISRIPQPKMRYRVGVDAHAFYLAHILLPEFIWKWLLHKAYKW